MSQHATEDEVKKTNHAQMDEMEKHRWLESEKAGQDVGKRAYFDWISKYARQWRESWEKRYTENEKEEEDDNSFAL